MATPWIGSRKVAVIPAIVNDPKYNPPPADWVSQIQQRLLYDPDPNDLAVDRSLRAYFFAISYGRALLEADVYPPVTVGPCDIEAAINATPAAAGYDYACVMFMDNTGQCGGGLTLIDNPPFSFNPPVAPDNLTNWCRVIMSDLLPAKRLGLWGMEFTHMITAFGDLYNTNPSPGRFDNMDCGCGTHPSTYTKLNLGWLDPGDIVTAPIGATSTYTLHALELLQPPPPGRVTAVRIPSAYSSRYFLVEARLWIDFYDNSTWGISGGIPSEGVVIYEIDEANWPVQLHTPTALTAGQQYTNTVEHLVISVNASVPGGFTLTVLSTIARVPVPDLVGLSPEEALDTAQQAGFGMYITQTVKGLDGPWISSQQPASGTLALPGTTINVVVLVPQGPPP